MSRPFTTALTAALIAAFSAAPVWSQTGGASPSPTQSPPTGAGGSPSGQGATSAGAKGMKSEVSRGDRRFVMEAAMGGMAEVHAGKVALEQGRSPEVKRFAEQMVKEHTTVNGELTKLAAARGITPPTEPDAAHRKALDALQKRSGAEFDRAYMKMQVDDHQKSVALFEKFAKGGDDAELKQWAQSKLPSLREHLKMARADKGSMSAHDAPGMRATSGASTTR